MKDGIKRLHLFLETIPDRLYPFSHEIEGRIVRGSEAYQDALKHAFETYGPNKYGIKLIAYRGSFHIVGSILFMIGATVVARDLFGSEIALYVLLGTAISALLVQEFFLHPRRYHQSTRKGIFDVMSWVVPMLLYMAFFSAS